MSKIGSTTSLAAERAARYMRERGRPVQSVEMAHAVLAATIRDEATATRVLARAFEGDARLVYASGGWQLTADPAHVPTAELPASTDADRTVLVIEGARAGRRLPFTVRSVAAVRLSGPNVVDALSGPTEGADAPALRSAVRQALVGAIPVVHDPPGGLAALESWLGEPLSAPVSVRRLARARLGLPALHDLPELVARVGMAWRDGATAVELADVVDAVLGALRGPQESLEDLRRACGGGAPPIPWGRFAFEREFLRTLPGGPGVYRFYDEAGALLYVGKARDLRRRIGSYFREGGPRTERVQKLLDRLHRIEVDPSGSDLEAVLREAAEIAGRQPNGNVQRRVRVGTRRGDRLESILILEPTVRPWVLKAYLIRRGRLIGRVLVGPRGGGLRRIERILDTRFFFPEEGPSAEAPVAVDVELIARWLAANRDRVVAFDPTDLKSAAEVVARLSWFLGSEAPWSSDGAPIRFR